jgi:hypothetical protein
MTQKPTRTPIVDSGSRNDHVYLGNARRFAQPDDTALAGCGDNELDRRKVRHERAHRREHRKRTAQLNRRRWVRRFDLESESRSKPGIVNSAVVQPKFDSIAQELTAGGINATAAVRTLYIAGASARWARVLDRRRGDVVYDNRCSRIANVDGVVLQNLAVNVATLTALCAARQATAAVARRTHPIMIIQV